MEDDIKWKEGYVLDLRGLYNRHGDLYSKNNIDSKRQHRCDDGLENMIKEYANYSPMTKAWCGEGDFKKILSQCKKK